MDSFDSLSPQSSNSSTGIFDPFATNSRESVPTVTYDTKKKQIETLMTTSGATLPNSTPLQPSSTPIAPVTFPAQTGFNSVGTQQGFGNNMSFPPTTGGVYVNPFLQQPTNNSSNPFA